MPIATTTESVRGPWVWLTSSVNLSRISPPTPLYALCKENTPFQWETLQQEAFEQLKTILVSCPCLTFPLDKGFILHIDGNKIAVGTALLKQHDPSGPTQAVGYFSKVLTPFH